ncbi:MAG: hypothetical protein HFG55_07540 [Lachnospiraceae bacterium]|nr:hypothetical protein [Lachnospiraceae bacterium]
MKKKQQAVSSVIAVIGLSSAMALCSLAAYSDSGPGVVNRWKQDERGWWYENQDGSYPVEQWQSINRKWYYFDAEGYMRANCWIMTDGKYYRLGDDGSMLSSQEIEIDGKRYTLNESGEVVDGDPQEMSEEEQAIYAHAQGIVAQITNDSMSKQQKAAAIYNWVRANTTYTSSGPIGDPVEAAVYGFRRHSGCCYEYYAMSHYMLMAAGMPNIEVVRASDNHHYWNLVDVDGTWYHFDTTPRRLGGNWCLVTTSYLQQVSWRSHNYDIEAYPKTP